MMLRLECISVARRRPTDDHLANQPVLLVDDENHYILDSARQHADHNHLNCV